MASRLLTMNKIQVFLRSFYTVRFIDGAINRCFEKHFVALPYKESDVMLNGFVAKEVKALHAGWHGSGNPECSTPWYVYMYSQHYDVGSRCTITAIGPVYFHSYH